MKERRDQMLTKITSGRSSPSSSMSPTKEREFYKKVDSHDLKSLLRFMALFPQAMFP